MKNTLSDCLYGKTSFSSDFYIGKGSKVDVNIYNKSKSVMENEIKHWKGDKLS